MQKITPNLWFNKNAKEAVDFYTTIFPDAKVLETAHYPTEGLEPFQQQFAGEVLSIEFELAGCAFMAINADDTFRPNPSISFFVNVDPLTIPDAEASLRTLWGNLLDGGMVLMPLQEYPFSKLYGWVEDKYGVSWQLILTNPEGEPRPMIVPSFMFANNRCGQGEAATDFYISLFTDAKRHALVKYGNDDPVGKPGSIMFSDFTLAGLFCSNGCTWNAPVFIYRRCIAQYCV